MMMRMNKMMLIKEKLWNLGNSTMKKAIAAVEAFKMRFSSKSITLLWMKRSVKTQV
jgi:hypothetical protein